MDPANRTIPDLRGVTCAHCGSPFPCGLGGDCWCAAEAFRLSIPASGGADCLCPACLRAAAANPASMPNA